MAKRGYKLQDFVAHAADVNCLNIGKKSCRIFVTGGEDCKVNLWEIGKPTPLLSLSGHTSSVQSVIIDSEEVLVLAGYSNGTVKLWDLEAAKLVRSITGHRSNCTAVEFHPFGEFLASGSLDTDLKIWDIRKKGCIHTYKGHVRGIRTIRFTPDGRWVVTGGEDHVVKLWDLTAGKLLHDFKFHSGTIRSIDFHPQEFLLATGSADRTVKFWDLETFELIGSAGPEATGVRSMVFHPDGRTLFCGLDETLKVFSWEPIRCHDFVDMGWSALGDLSIYEGKLLGCSYHQSCVGVWVADISLIGPYASGVVPKKNALMEPIDCCGEGHSADPKRSCTNSSMTMVEGPPDCGGKTKQRIGGSFLISNVCNQGALQGDPIYSSNTNHFSTVFTKHNVSGSCPAPQKINSKSEVSTLNTFRVSKGTEVSPCTKNKTQSSFAPRETSPCLSTFSANSSSTLRKGPMMEFHTVRTTARPVSASIIVPRDSLDQESVACNRKGTASAERMVSSTVFRKLKHMRQPSFSSDGSDSQMVAAASRPSSSSADDLGDTDLSFFSSLAVNGETVTVDESNSTGIRNVAKKFERIMSLEQPVGSNNDRGAQPQGSTSESSSVKYVKGVAVQLGRTRSLVENWEKRERFNSNYTTTNEEVYTTAKETKEENDFSCETLMQGHDVFINAVKSRLTKLQVIRHFWKHNGIKGAIDAVVKLPDNPVQVDVMSVLLEKIDLFTLDIFSCLLPLLSGLLNSKIERHATVSLELLLELVKIFGPVIHSTISGSSFVGVDLQAEQRLERCKQCYNNLQKIRQILPLLTRKGGLLAKHAQKLNLALNEW